MNTRTNTWRDQVRITFAIAAKDILDALKNKSTISVIISALFVVVAYRFLPALSSGGTKTNILVYDASNSIMVESLEGSPVLDLYTYSSEDRFHQALSGGGVPELGLIIPAGFTLQSTGAGVNTIQGYLLYWVSEADAQEMKQLVEAEINRLTGQDISIEIQQERIFPQGLDNTRAVWASMSLVFMSIMIGVSLVPHLILEEKQAHTLEALIVSPANSYQFVAGKALAGLFYSMTGAAIVLGIYHDIIFNWWIAILAALSIATFPVSIGLWLGMRIDNRGQLMMWAWIVIVPLFMPVLLYLLAELFPAWLNQLAQYIPTVTGLNLLLTAFSKEFSTGIVLLQLGWIFLCSILILLAISRMLRLSDRAHAQTRSGWTFRVNQALKSFLPDLQTSAEDKVSVEVTPQAQSQLVPDIAGWQYDVSKSTTKTSKAGLLSSLRLIWVIAAKDIRDAIRNKLFISILIGVTLMAGQTVIIPLLLKGSDTPTAVVFSEGSSKVIRELAQQEGVRVIPVDTRNKMEEYITESPRTQLGLILPENFDQQVLAGNPIQLQAYTAHWSNTDKISGWLQIFEAKFAALGATGVAISPDWELLYPADEIAGQPSIALFIMVIGILTIGTALVPILFVEEKEAHTMEVLLVSPAKTWQVIVAKMLVGVFYGSIAAMGLLLLNNYLIVNWGIAILASLGTILFAGAIGTLVGILSENPTTTGMWGGLVILAVLATTFLRFFENVNMPPALQILVDWSPGASMLNLFGAAMTMEISPDALISNLAILLGVGLVIYLLAGMFFARKVR